MSQRKEGDVDVVVLDGSDGVSCDHQKAEKTVDEVAVSQDNALRVAGGATLKK